jgi:MOSC domain-containing protein YiiM
MDEQHQGLTAALQPDWRGGVACRVLNDAEIRIGDPVAVEG